MTTTENYKETRADQMSYEALKAVGDTVAETCKLLPTKTGHGSVMICDEFGFGIVSEDYGQGISLHTACKKAMMMLMDALEEIEAHNNEQSEED